MLRYVSTRRNKDSTRATVRDTKDGKDVSIRLGCSSGALYKASTNGKAYSLQPWLGSC